MREHDWVCYSSQSCLRHLTSRNRYEVVRYDEACRVLDAQEAIKGSCSLMLLTEKGIYAARDRFGKTPVIVGKKDEGFAVAFETCAFPNLGYEVERELGPGDIVLVTADGVAQKVAPGKLMSVCSFLWVYYGFPASSYEGVNVEDCRNRCGGEKVEFVDIQ